MQAPTDKNLDSLPGMVADLAAEVERMKSDIAELRHAANRIRPTGKPYNIQTSNPSRELDQPSVTLANLTKVVAALVDDLAQAGIVRKA